MEIINNELWWLGVFKQLADGGFKLMRVIHKDITMAIAEKKADAINRQLGHKMHTDGTFIVDEGEVFVMIDEMDVCPIRGLELSY